MEVINLLQTTYMNPGIVSAESSLCATIHWGSAWVFLICSHTQLLSINIGWKTTGVFRNWHCDRMQLEARQLLVRITSSKQIPSTLLSASFPLTLPRNTGPTQFLSMDIGWKTTGVSGNKHCDRMQLEALQLLVRNTSSRKDPSRHFFHIHVEALPPSTGPTQLLSMGIGWKTTGVFEKSTVIAYSSKFFNSSCHPFRQGEALHPFFCIYRRRPLPPVKSKIRWVLPS